MKIWSSIAVAADDNAAATLLSFAGTQNHLQTVTVGSVDLRWWSC